MEAEALTCTEKAASPDCRRVSLVLEDFVP